MLRNFFRRRRKTAAPPTDGGEAPETQTKETDTMASSSQLSDITRGLYHVASSTTAMVAQQYIHILQQFFDQMDDGTLQAKMAKVAVDDVHFIMVPLISLVSPTGFNLDKMKVGLAVRVDGVDVKQATHPADDSDVTRSSFSVSISPRPDQTDRHGDAMTIDLEFISHAPPEGVMRIIDSYTNLIRPLKLVDGMFPPVRPVSLKEVAEVEREGEGEAPMPGDEPDRPPPPPAAPPPASASSATPAPRRPEDGPGMLPVRV
ncbi:hypothetical protein GALL_325810 [mine drainage metagenome]|uniref:DUF2589 domain-containing protein n=1 Tax=mine drainage metagenome TaxID=410659 RepID=A0A1J5RBR3_9ZZZZ